MCCADISVCVLLVMWSTWNSFDFPILIRNLSMSDNNSSQNHYFGAYISIGQIPRNGLTWGLCLQQWGSHYYIFKKNISN